MGEILVLAFWLVKNVSLLSLQYLPRNIVLIRVWPHYERWHANGKSCYEKVILSDMYDRFVVSCLF